MTQDQTPPSPPMPDEDALLEQARHEAQERVAELHVEEGTVKSEKGQNSPHPDDHD
jgi:hypothetical protein